MRELRKLSKNRESSISKQSENFVEVFKQMQTHDSKDPLRIKIDSAKHRLTEIWSPKA